MKCKSCGYDNVSNADNCLNCGEIIQSGEKKNRESEQSEENRDPSPEKNNQSKVNSIISLLTNNLVRLFLGDNSVESSANKEPSRVTDMFLVDPIGQVYGFSQQEEPISEHKNLVWKFRVHVFDQAGAVIHRLLVEMRGDSFTGIINDGDVVKLPGRWRINEVITPDEVINTTLGIKVGADRRASKLPGTKNRSVLNPVGQVNGFSQQTETRAASFGREQEQILVWRFQVHTFDTAGNQIYRIPVEFRGKQFTGAVGNGDVVKLSGLWNQGEVFKPKEIFNQTLGVQIRASFMTPWQRVGTFAVGIFILFVFMPLFTGVELVFGFGTGILPAVLNNEVGLISIIIVLLFLLIPLSLTIIGINLLRHAWRER